MMINPATYIRDLKRRFIADKYSKKYKNIFFIDGIKFFVPISVEPNIRYILAKGRGYEVDEIRFLKRILRTGMNVIELGGSIGIVSGIVRNIIGPDSKHIIVEANSELISICKHNANPKATTFGTEVICKALAYSVKDKVGFKKGTNSHTGRLCNTGENADQEIDKIELHTLVKKLSDTDSYVLICDIEGAEYDMFRIEAKDTFKNLSFAVIGMRSRIYKSLGLKEDEFFNILSSKGLQILDRSGDILLLKGPAA